MKPKPFSALNHLTVPCATCASPELVEACGAAHRTGEPTPSPSEPAPDRWPGNRANHQATRNQRRSPTTVSHPPGVGPVTTRDPKGSRARTRSTPQPDTDTASASRPDEEPVSGSAAPSTSA